MYVSRLQLLHSLEIGFYYKTPQIYKTNLALLAQPFPLVVELSITLRMFHVLFLQRLTRPLKKIEVESRNVSPSQISDQLYIYIYIVLNKYLMYIR